MVPHAEKPSKLLSFLELRAPFEALSLIPALPLLKHAPRGDGHPVLVLPGFFASDSSTYLLRRYLNQQGFSAYPWELGMNPGLQDKICRRLDRKIDELSRRHGKKVSLVGWSLGGVYARALAQFSPDNIRQVITLGSPFNLTQTQNTSDVAVSGPIIRMYEKMNPDIASDPLINGEAVWIKPPPMPSTCIYSQDDGITSWKYCVDEVENHTENVRVIGSHAGLTHNPLVMYTIADRLSQHENNWQPFTERLAHRLLFLKSQCATDAGNSARQN